MISKVLIEKNSYYDSVTLMSLSGNIKNEDGVVQAVVSMATDMNKDLLKNIGLLTEDAKNASENDLIIAIEAQTDEAAEQVILKVKEQLDSKKESNKNSEEKIASSSAEAFKIMEDANLAVISVRGDYAAREAKKALKNGLHVMIFSDNVTVEEEKELKELGREKGLLVMGPDCGTSIINQAGLCFSNKVSPGKIGLVAASGTGLQEVAVQIDKLGYGISQAIGVGGRDLSAEIGGIMMLESLNALDNDAETEVIVLISKPPAPSVEEKILNRIKEASKPVIVCFLDGNAQEAEKTGATFARTLKGAAIEAVRKLETSENTADIKSDASEWILEQKKKISDSQKYIRGLFCGGTLTSESLMILREHNLSVKSNVAKKEHEKLKNISVSHGHVLIDMGDDQFTVGKPHPMIEPSLRNERIMQEAQDAETAVLLLDFELGYGSHDNPVGVTYDTLVKAKEAAKTNGRFLPIVAYVLGTYNDKQNYYEQVKMLENLDIYVADSNEEAAEIAAKLVTE